MMTFFFFHSLWHLLLFIVNVDVPVTPSPRRELGVEYISLLGGEEGLRWGGLGGGGWGEGLGKGTGGG